MPIHYDKDPYAILGLSRTATDAEIKRTYRRLARQYHPDLNKDSRAAERMKDINWAYSILGDARERFAYNLWRDSVARASANPGVNSSPSPQTRQWKTYTTDPSWSQPRLNTAWSGSGAVFLCWILYTLISGLLRDFPISQPSYSYELNSATETALVSFLESILPTYAVTMSPAQTRTPHPLFNTTDTLVPTIFLGVNENIRDQVVPGTIEWDWIDSLLAEYGLTTPTGLSNEVLRVRRDEDGSIFVETRSYGAFFIYVNADLEPMLIPLAITPVP